MVDALVFLFINPKREGGQGEETEREIEIERVRETETETERGSGRTREGRREGEREREGGGEGRSSTAVERASRNQVSPQQRRPPGATSNRLFQPQNGRYNPPLWPQIMMNGRSNLEIDEGDRGTRANVPGLQTQELLTQTPTFEHACPVIIIS